MAAPNRASIYRHCRRGFTLPELLVGLAIMGAVMAFSAPAISRSVRTHKLRSAATQMHSMLVKARSAAVTHRSTIRIDIWPDTGITITREDEDNDGNFETFLGWNFMPNGIQMASADFAGAEWISFAPNGVPSSQGVIRVEGPSGQAREIRVAAGSGSATVENPGLVQVVN